MSYPIYQVLAQEIENLNLGIDIAWESEDFETPTGEDPEWISIHYLPTPKDSLMKGEFGLDEVVGLFQINCYGKAGVGVGSLYQRAETITNHFKHGKTITYKGQSVYVQNSGMAAGISDGNWIYIPVTISFKGDIQRV